MPAEGKAAVSREILHQEGFYPEESSGLFVGISSFDDERFAEVRFAVDDAVDLAWIFSLELGLVEASRCVLALAGVPQKEVSRQRLAALLAAGARREQPGLTKVYHLATELSQAGSPRGLFVLAAATHGLSESGGDYLVASDTQRSRLLRTAIAIPELFDTAATASAARRLVLLDACRERLSQDRAVADAAMSQSFAAAITEAEGLTVLSGSTAGGYAYDDAEKQNGVFTGALVDGLLGAAPTDGRGFITVATLADFAQQRVQEWVQRHRREHLGLSRGIERRFDEAAQLLPLAIDPRRSLALAEYQERRAAALARVHQYIGKILKGRTSTTSRLSCRSPSRCRRQWRSYSRKSNRSTATNSRSRACSTFSANSRHRRRSSPQRLRCQYRRRQYRRRQHRLCLNRRRQHRRRQLRHHSHCLSRRRAGRPHHLRIPRG